MISYFDEVNCAYYLPMRQTLNLNLKMKISVNHPLLNAYVDVDYRLSADKCREVIRKLSEDTNVDYYYFKSHDLHVNVSLIILDLHSDRNPPHLHLADFIPRRRKIMKRDQVLNEINPLQFALVHARNNRLSGDYYPPVECLSFKT